MPKLNPTLSSEVKEAASGGFLLPPGRYRARLVEVEAKQAASSGNPMWTWKYEVIEEGHRGNTQWNNTVLTDKALWKVAESFAAFGVETDTDTDELIGCTVTLVISERIIQQGTRAGQKGNNVDQVDVDDSPDAIRHPKSTIEGGTAAAGAGSTPVSVEDVEGRF
jgi:hypothetical protein